MVLLETLQLSLHESQTSRVTLVNIDGLYLLLDGLLVFSATGFLDRQWFFLEKYFFAVAGFFADLSFKVFNCAEEANQNRLELFTSVAENLALGRDEDEST